VQPPNFSAVRLQKLTYLNNYSPGQLTTQETPSSSSFTLSKFWGVLFVCSFDLACLFGWLVFAVLRMEPEALRLLGKGTELHPSSLSNF
jgi:hypothetical protein